MMRNVLRVALPCVVVLCAGLAGASEPTTPLGKWMKPNVGAPLAGQDLTAGATAAGKQDLAGVKASCKQCHDLYKESYKKDFASRPFP
ncbi:MAG: hypothetical protein ABSC94_07535 [Polyangiaceae bacterium]